MTRWWLQETGDLFLERLPCQQISLHNTLIGIAKSPGKHSFADSFVLSHSVSLLLLTVSTHYECPFIVQILLQSSIESLVDHPWSCRLVVTLVELFFSCTHFPKQARMFSPGFFVSDFLNAVCIMDFIHSL